MSEETSPQAAQAGQKRDGANSAARIALVGTIVAALIGATATITVALLQRNNSGPATFTSAPPASPKSVFDTGAVQDGVRGVLINSYGVARDQIESVRCPTNQEVKAGSTFTCTVELGGTNPGQKQVDITVRNDSGAYEVGALR